jgi:hypothetical protein
MLKTGLMPWAMAAIHLDTGFLTKLLKKMRIKHAECKQFGAASPLVLRFARAAVLHICPIFILNAEIDL